MRPVQILPPPARPKRRRKKRSWLLGFLTFMFASGVVLFLAGSAVGLLATTQGRLYSSAWYALRNAKTPLRYAIVRVLLGLLDTIDWPTAFLGCLKAGVVAVPVNTLMTEDDYRFMLADSRARVLIVSDALYPKFASVIAECPELTVVVSGDSSSPLASVRPKFANAPISRASPSPCR